MAVKKSQLYSSLWASCDKLRGGMDASQYKDYILTLLFIKYVSDKYKDDPYGAIAIPKGASFEDLVALKGNKNIGEKIDKLIAKLAEANNLTGIINNAHFNDESKIGKGDEMVDKLTGLIAIFQKPELDFKNNKAEDDELSQEVEILKKCKAYEASIKSQKKTIADLKKKLDENCRKRYDSFTDSEITDLLVNRKWYKKIDQGIQNLYVTVANHLTKRIVELYERYENTLPELTAKLAEEEKEVSVHLAQMGFKL